VLKNVGLQNVGLEKLLLRNVVSQKIASSNAVLFKPWDNAPLRHSL